jgi:hypothetical protein
MPIKSLLGRLLATIAGLAMVANGTVKLLGVGAVVTNMARIHFEGPMLIAQGAVELGLGVLALAPRTRNIGLVGLMAVLIGAVAAHLGAGQPFSEALPAAVALAPVVVGFVLLNATALRDLFLRP